MNNLEKKIDKLSDKFEKFCLETSVKIAKIETRNAIISAVIGGVAALVIGIIGKKWS